MEDSGNRPGRFGLPEELEESDTREGFDFPPPERKVVTQSYDLSIQTLSDQWKGGLIGLPEIQREYVWDDARASRLIESLLLNIPIPVLYFAETPDAKYEVIDGHQRVRSVARFLSNEFRLRSLAVLDEYNGKRYFELPEREQRFLLMRSIRAVIISAESHPTMKFEIFERLNTGSIALNAQELRNSLYRGPFNRLLRTLVMDPAFRDALGRPKPRRRMADEELVLRFLALHDEYPTYKPPLKRFLNEFMGKHQDAGGEWLDHKRELFTATMARIASVFGDSAFRIADKSGNPIDTLVVRALFDAQMLTFAHVTTDVTPQHRRAVARQMAPLYEDDEFADVLRRATGDRSRVRMRVERVAEAARRAGLEVRFPTNW